MKQWYFYDENGDVRIIYNIEPPHELLEQGNYIIAGKPAEKFGYDMILKVNMQTKELIVKYVVISSGGSSSGGGSIDTSYLDELNKKFDNAVLQGSHLKFYANGTLVKEIVLPTSSSEGGQKGNDGVGLEFQWRGTELGIKRTDQSEYTYVNLQGKQGDNGKTPNIYIGDNGNWYVDGRDTGKSSRGRDGSSSGGSGSGSDGRDGTSLDFTWKSTKLGIKRSDQSNYTYVDLKGQDGLSAYQIAQQNGFKGTEQEWLQSLHGKDGTGGSTSIGKVNLSDVVLDKAGIDALNTKISYGHDHKMNQVISSAKKWADNKYILDDIIEYLHTDLDNYKTTTNNEIKNLKDNGSCKAPVITIGLNGNWYIDGKDTGKPSRGENGKDGTSSGGGTSTGKIELKDIDLDEKGLQTLNDKIAYKHNHQGTQVVCGTKSWANNKYILEDIIDFLGSEIVSLKQQIKDMKASIK